MATIQLAEQVKQAETTLLCVQLLGAAEVLDALGGQIQNPRLYAFAISCRKASEIIKKSNEPLREQNQ